MFKVKNKNKNKIVSEITQEQVKLMSYASQHTKFPLTEDEIIEVAIQSYYTGFKREFPKLFPKNSDPVHAEYWV
jgi:hypothetical protein